MATPGDGARLQQILKQLGFDRCETMFNDLQGTWSRRGDKPATHRRIKILWADSIAEASNDKKWELVNTLRAEFGDRLISCGLVPDRQFDRDSGKLLTTDAFNYVVKLKV